ncbi:FUSC family protein [Photobacterium kishitanii]|uniref:FUSC family protein n=3 Tax=Photobacterium kishitanii TaxID=318456 RepID=A0AAX0YZ41_9GAMM|nr:FUSC family protein [Photobacterium kishitanii]PSX20443.1 FUSC family protein [Photobacterium kishitanii]PSX29204.1 FUSC family protein [Photobacterium kishitanii]PSX33596.1 FUSC family protein [Photobacterium kishitanii]PSX46128.1 FUSC family protein [Photobacterium kishitanii]
MNISVLYERAKLPIKVALTLSIAMMIAIWLGWDRPYWAGLAVTVMSMMETSGHSLRKGKWRLVGTFCGTACAFFLLAFFAQDVGIMMALFTLLVGISGYMIFNPRYGYIWAITTTVCSLILVMGDMTPINDFNLATLRLEETLLGFICHIVVFSILWPQSSRPVFEDAVLDLLKQQQTNLINRRHQLIKSDQHTVTQPALGEGLKLVMRLQDLLYAAEADSYNILREKKSWQYIIEIGDQWAIAIGHLTEAIDLLKEANLEAEKSKIDSIFMYLLHNFQQCESIVKTGKAPNKRQITCFQYMKLGLHSETDMHTQGALLLLERQLNNMAKLSDELVLAFYSAYSGDRWYRDEQSLPKPVKRWSLDTERLIASFKIMLIVSSLVLIWYYYNPPGGSLMIALGTIFGLTFIGLPFANMKTILAYIVGWSGFVLLEYIFIIPFLDQPYQIALFYFFSTFFIWFKFSGSKYLVSRVMGTMILIISTKSVMCLTPVYDPKLAISILVSLSIGLLLIIFFNDFPFSAQPERVMLRRLQMLRNVLAWQLRYAVATIQERRRWWVPIVGLLYNIRPIKLVMGADNAAKAIKWKNFPEVSEDQAQVIIQRLYLLVLRINSLKDGYAKWRLNTKDDLAQSMVKDSILRIAAALEHTDGYQNLLVLEQEMLSLYNDVHRRIHLIDRQVEIEGDISLEEALNLHRALASLGLLVNELKILSEAMAEFDFKALEIQYFTV